MKNTLQRGTIRCIVFRDGDEWYAAGLEFNIVESGSTPREALLLLFEAMQGYLESAKKIKVRPHILNQKTDAEYETLWKNLEEQKIKQSKNIYFYGRLNLAQLNDRSLVPA